MVKFIHTNPLRNSYRSNFKILKNSRRYYWMKYLKEAQAVAKLIAEKLDYIGTMCVEYFIDQNNTLLVNEIAPRVHNSGHLTINAFNISQFENHVRAVCGLKMEMLKNC